MTEHLGYEAHDTAGRDGGNSRNGTRPKTVLTEIGPVEIEVPRDRDASFEPVIVKKRQRRLDGLDEIVLSLTARGLTTGEVAAHFDEVYGAKVSKDTISRITDKVVAEMGEWSQRPLDAMYPVLFVDAIHVKVRDGQVTNRPFYVVIGVTVDGHRDVLGIWAGDGGEGAKYWLQVLTEIKNRGVTDACIVVCDGLKGLPESITTVWPQALVQVPMDPRLLQSLPTTARAPSSPTRVTDLHPVAWNAKQRPDELRSNPRLQGQLSSRGRRAEPPLDPLINTTSHRADAVGKRAAPRRGSDVSDVSASAPPLEGFDPWMVKAPRADRPQRAGRDACSAVLSPDPIADVRPAPARVGAATARSAPTLHCWRCRTSTPARPPAAGAAVRSTPEPDRNRPPPAPW